MARDGGGMWRWSRMVEDCGRLWGAVGNCKGGRESWGELERYE